MVSQRYPAKSPTLTAAMTATAKPMDMILAKNPPTDLRLTMGARGCEKRGAPSVRLRFPVERHFLAGACLTGEGTV